MPRPRLTKKNLDNLAAKMRHTYGWHSDPKAFQLEAIKAQLEGVDTIVQAPIGAGKTAIAAGPYLWPGSEKKFTIMVCPLLSIEEEMVRFFLLPIVYTKNDYVSLSTGEDIRDRL